MADLKLSQPLPEGSSRGGSLEKLGSDLARLLIRVPDEDYSDLTVIAGGKKVPVHRCILAARCPGLRKVLKEIEQSGNSKLELELDSIVKNGKIGPEAFVAVMGYVYGGKLEPWPVAIPCHDNSCSHSTCRPAIDYVLEILCAAQLFNLPEVKILAEQHLIEYMKKFQVDDMLRIHHSTSTTKCTQLQSACLTALASSKLDNLTLEKQFFGVILERVKKLRVEFGNHLSHLAPLQEMQCKRIHRALDSDDVELVRMLVDEKKLNLDQAHGLHYAAAYCHPRTLAHLLDLNLADLNGRNERGMTVLHVAAWRQEPQAIAKLLEKGVQVKLRTLDNQTALDISRRLVRKTNMDREEDENERICITILEQAEKKHTLVVPKSAADMLSLPATEEELMSQLLYLENRVALARLLYPREADIVMGISHLETYAAFTGDNNMSNHSGAGIASRKRKPSVDLNEVPTTTLAGLVGAAAAEQSKEARLELLRQRCDALRHAGEFLSSYHWDSSFSGACNFDSLTEKLF
ncbi:hypothetical protein M758_8G163200 [Ceratodon purpureus]|nr:hypothetical protein M758_8G163200 [Ceratodon purpureus]